MNRRNVSAIGKAVLAQLDARADRSPELDADALAEAWDAACDDEGADYATLCSPHGRTPAASDTEE